MKFSDGDLVKITGGTRPELLGVCGYVMNTTKKTVWILLIEGPHKGSVISKRNLKDVTPATDDDRQTVFANHGLTGTHDQHTLFVALPNNHPHSKDDLKAVFASKMGVTPQNICILPSSRNALVYFAHATVVTQFLATKKSITLDGRICRVGLYYGAAVAAVPVVLSTRTTTNTSATLRHADNKRPSPEQPNRRAIALKNAGGAKRPRY